MAIYTNIEKRKVKMPKEMNITYLCSVRCASPLLSSTFADTRANPQSSSPCISVPSSPALSEPDKQNSALYTFALLSEMALFGSLILYSR